MTVSGRLIAEYRTSRQRLSSANVADGHARGKVLVVP